MMRRGIDDRSYIDSRVGAIDAPTLAVPVREALDDPGASVLDWRFEPVGYDFLNPSSGGVYRFTGSAEGIDGRVPWGLVLKVTRSAEGLDRGKPVPADLERALGDAVRWDRELLAYESGFLESVDGELTAARCHGRARHDDRTAWLWLEDLGAAFGGDEWSARRWHQVARAFGRFNAGCATARHEWLGRGWLRTWVTKLTPFHFPLAVTSGPQWDEPLIASAYPPELRQRLGRLWADRELLLAAVEAIPPVCSHLDSHRRNLAVGQDGVIAIDWGLVGLAAPGEEIASSLVGTVASGEARDEQTDELAETLFEGYLEGLREGGWSGADADVRLGFAAASGLRVFSVLGFGADQEALPRLATLARSLLRLGEEARALAG